MAFNLSGRTPRLAGGSQPTESGPCYAVVVDVVDRVNNGGAARWQQEQAGSISRQYKLELRDPEGAPEQFAGSTTAYFFNVPGDSTNERVAARMLDGMRLVAESAGYTAEELEETEVELDMSDMGPLEDGTQRELCGYYFAGDDTHWGQFVLLTPELHAQALDGSYTPSKPKLKVKKDRSASITTVEDDTDTEIPEVAPRPAAPAPRPSAPVRPGAAAPGAPAAKPAAKPVAATKPATAPAPAATTTAPARPSLRRALG